MGRTQRSRSRSSTTPTPRSPARRLGGTAQRSRSSSSCSCSPRSLGWPPRALRAVHREAEVGVVTRQAPPVATTRFADVLTRPPAEQPADVEPAPLPAEEPREIVFDLEGV